ncbi:MAG TPA: alpha-L-fucosidase [Chloroflexi bacterium]|nr:alpha-L-fucosidase [Chloroflexota bacterium]
MTNVVVALHRIEQRIAAGPFRAGWDSLRGYRVPDLYLDGKFGIFIHWGVYSVPAFGNEWYPRNMYQQGTPEFEHHLATYGPHRDFGYKDFIPQFRAERYDPAAWADLFQRAGARFVVPVAEHHDGFAMYDSGFSEWCATRMGPRRDLIGELAEAVRRKGMVFGVSSHRAEHWWFMDGGKQFDSDVQDPRYAEFYGPAEPRDTPPDAWWMDDWLARTCEIVDKYRPQLVWFDWWIEQPVFKPYLQKFAAYYYNRGEEWGQGVAINYKHDAYAEGTAVYDVERGQLAEINPRFWQTDTSISKNSWGYVREQQYKSATSIIHDLVDIVSKNGALLLNIGPRPDGTIPEEETETLLEIGRWLEMNGEAIYGTRPWAVFGEGPTQVVPGSFSDTKRDEFTARDWRFTRRGDTLYATLLAWPTDGRATIRTLAEGSEVEQPVNRVELLGGGPVRWQRTSEGLTVELPAEPPCGHAWVLKIE